VNVPVRADCTIAVSLEEPSILQDGFDCRYGESHPGTPRLSFHSPLVPPGSSFASLQTALGIRPATAWILDEIRALIDAAYALPYPAPPQALKLLRAMALEVHHRISHLPPSGPVRARMPPEPLSLLPSYPDFSASSRSSPPPSPFATPPCAELDPFYTAARLAATLYAKAIATRRPLGEVCSEADALSVLTASWRIPLARWRGMLGIFMWIMLSILPTVHRKTGKGNISAKLHTRFAKSILQCGWMQMSLENWTTCNESMQRALWFQRWLRQGARDDGWSQLIRGDEHKI